MRILWVFCIYNEIELLPFKIDYMRKNDIDFYVFDNMSNDGSWEWLKDNNIPSEQFDTNEMFEVTTNVKLMNTKIHELKPDWVTMAGTDQFYVHLTKNNLREVIESVDKDGFNCIRSGFRTFDFKFTGEEVPGEDPRLIYMYYGAMSIDDIAIAKCSGSLRLIHPDRFIVPEQKLYCNNEFVLLHYSMRHDAKERKTDQFNRRSKAWKNGTVPPNWGSHYRRIVGRGKFIYDKESLLDVRNSGFWEQIKVNIENG